MRSWLIALACSIPFLDTVTARPTELHQAPLSGESSRYEKTVQAWRFNTTTPSDAHKLLELAKTFDGDVWSVTRDHIDLHLPTSYVPSALSGFEKHTIELTIPAPSTPPYGSSSWNVTELRSQFHSEYHRLEDIKSFINELSETYPRLVEVVRIGLSSEGREIIGVKIEEPGSKRVRPRIVVQGAQHARDWVAISSALYFAHALVVPSYQLGSVNELLEHFAFTIIPVPNPDGYDYTWTTDRLWYKNRLPEPTSQCTGIDMNRNWGFHWQESGDPCHHWYGGGRPFEAPEVSALASYIERTTNIKMFIDLRSYGQLLVYPFSYSCEEIPPHAEDLIEAALGAARANHQVHGTYMATGAACELLYSAPGNVIDWAYAEAGISFSYSVFLRDTGAYGFMLPPIYIRPVGEESSMLIHYLAEFLVKNHKV